MGHAAYNIHSPLCSSVCVSIGGPADMAHSYHSEFSLYANCADMSIIADCSEMYT